MIVLCPSCPTSPIFIVSGLPRSGTSMMMQMLIAGGLQALTDHIRTADDDNPRGYYELEQVKRLPEGDTDWLDQAHGKVVKVVTALLPHLPAKHLYRVIIMRRSLEEVLSSQEQMLKRRGAETRSIADDDLGGLFQRHLRQVDGWLDMQSNVRRIDVDYGRLISDPLAVVANLGQFLGRRLDARRLVGVIDPSLYRQRSGSDAK